MKVVYCKYYVDKLSGTEVSIEQAVSGKVDSDSMDQIDGLRDNVNDLTKIVGILATVLVDKNLISATQLSQIIGYRYEVVE